MYVEREVADRGRYGRLGFLAVSWVHSKSNCCCSMAVLFVNRSRLPFTEVLFCVWESQSGLLEGVRM